MDELDELRLKIAQAKGWNWREWPNDDKSVNRAFRQDDKFTYGAWMTASGEIVVSPVLPDWSRDIAAAWDLFDEVQEEPYGQAVELRRCVSLNPVWHCSIGTHTRRGDTAPEAICRAWLAWKEAS